MCNNNRLFVGPMDRFHCYASKKLNQKLSSAKSYEIVILKKIKNETFIQVLGDINMPPIMPDENKNFDLDL